MASTYVPSCGGVLAATVTVTFAVPVIPSLSVTLNVIVCAPGAALHDAAIDAETVPLLLVRPVSVIPAGTLVAVTTRLPAASSASLTPAIACVVAALPAVRLNGDAGVITGGAPVIRSETVLILAPVALVAFS